MIVAAHRLVHGGGEFAETAGQPGRQRLPRRVSRSPEAVRLKTGFPSASSVRITCWLTAPMVTPSSSAAAARLP